MRIIGLTASLFLVSLLWSNVSSAASDTDLESILNGHAEDYVQSSRLSAPFSASVERIVSGDLRVRPRVSSVAWEELLPMVTAYAAFTQYEDAPRQESLLIGAVEKLRGVSQAADLHADILGIVVADRCQRLRRQGCLDPFRGRHGNVVAFMEAREKKGAPAQAFHLDTKQLERAKRLSMPFYEVYSELLKALSEADWNGDTQKMMGALVQAESHFGKSDPITWAVYRNVYALAMAGKLHPDPVASMSLALSLARDRLEGSEYQSASGLNRKALENDAANAFYHIYKAEVGKKVEGNACLMGPKVACRVAIVNRPPAADDPRVPLSGEELATELVLAFKDAVSQRRTAPWLAALKMATVDLSLRMVGDQMFDEAASLVSEVVDVVTTATWMDQDIALDIMVAISASCDSGFEEKCLVSLKERRPQLFLRAEDWRFEVGGEYTPERHQEMANAYVERNMAWGAARHYPRLVLAVIEVYGASSPEAGTGISNYQKLCEAAPGACDNELDGELERIRSVRVAFARQAVDDLRRDPGPESQQYLAALASLCREISPAACDKVQRAELARLTASFVKVAVSAALEKQREDARKKTSESHVWGPVGWLVGKAASRSERVLLPVPNLPPEEMARWLSFRLEALEKARKDYHWEVDDDDGYGAATFHEISGDLSRFVEGAQWLFPPADTLAASKQDPWADWQGQIEAGAKLAESGKIEDAVALYAGGLARLQAVFPDFDGPLPGVMKRLGDWEFKLGRRDKSLSYRLQVLAIHEGHSGDVLQQIVSLEAVADSLRALGRGSEADGYVQKAAAIRTAQRAKIRGALRSAYQQDGQDGGIRIETDSLSVDGASVTIPTGWVSELVDELIKAEDSATAAKLAELYFSTAWTRGGEWAEGEIGRATVLYIESVGKICKSLLASGANAEAVRCRQRQLYVVRALVGPDSSSDLQLLELFAVGMLATTYRAVERPAEALPLAEQVLTARRRLQGEEHPDTLQAMSTLAAIYGEVGREEDALSLEEQVLTTRRRLLGEEHPDTLMAMGNLAAAYHALGRTSDALPLQERVLAMSRQLLGDEHLATSVAMGNLAATYSKLGRAQDAVPLQELCVGVIRRVLGENHTQTLTSMGNLATTYEAVGRAKDALPLREHVLAVRRRLQGEGHPDSLAAMDGLAATYHELDRAKDALPLREHVLAARRRLQGEEHPDTLAAMGGLAATYLELGRANDALPLREQVLAARRRLQGEEHPDTLGAMDGLAATYLELGRAKDALRLLEMCVVASRRLLGEEHRDTLISMGNLAVIYVALGQYVDALVLQEHVLSVRRRLLGEEHEDTLSAMGNLAGTYREMGRSAEALPLWERISLTRHSRLGKEHPETLRAIFSLAETYRELGRAAEAQPLQEAVLSESRRLLGEDHPDTIRAMGSLAGTYRELGRATAALQLQERVLATRRRTLGDDHLETMKAMNNLAVIYGALGRPADELEVLEVLVRETDRAFGPEHSLALAAKSNLAAAYQKQGQMKRAADVLVSYIAAAESLRANPMLTAANRRALFSSHIVEYRLQARLLAALDNVQESFRTSELSKARTLLESTALERANRAGVLPPEEQAKVDRLNVEAKGTDDAVAKAGTNLDLKLQLEKRRNDLQREYAALLADLKARFPRYAQLVDVAILDAPQGASGLPEGALFLSFLPTDKGWLLYSLDRQGALAVHALPEQALAGLNDKVARYREGLADAAAGSGAPWRGLQMKGNRAADVDLPALAAELGALLLGPVRQRLGQYRQLIISPDGVLATLPFETLLLDGKPLVAGHDVTYAQSLSVYALLKARGDEYAALRQRQPLFAMGNPVYQSPGHAGRAAKAGISEDALSAMVTRGGANGVTQAYDYLQLQWDNLPGTARELSAVERLFGTRSLQGDKATEAQLRQLNREGTLANYRYLLFSAHGYLSLQEPALSALVLSQDPKHRDAANDGYVSASEWPAYNLKSDLLVLSACETALGKQAQGEGIMGLPYALYVAGNKNTLLTLWQIDDAASAEFIERFFRKLKEGQDQVRALNETKREFLRDERLSNPRYWAPFVMYGA